MGKNFFLTIYGFTFNVQTIIIIWLVINLVAMFSFSVTRKLNLVPHYYQSLMENTLEFIINITKSQMGEINYEEWIPFVGTLFIFILICNWIGILTPWKILKLPEGELTSPINDVNTTVALALLTSLSYFYAGLKKKKMRYLKKYISPTSFLLPIFILEEVAKPLSLSFRLFGNVLADDLTISVLTRLAPFLIPLPALFLGFFAGSIQAVIFSTLAAAYISEAIE